MNNPSVNKPKLLVLAGKITREYSVDEALGGRFDVDVSETMGDALEKLRHGSYHAIIADVGDFLPLERGLVDQQSSLVLNTIGEGVCIVDANGKCTWSNKQMHSFSPQVFEEVKQICCQAWSIFSKHRKTYGDRAVQRSRKFTIHAEGERYFEVMTSPVVDDHGEAKRVVAVVWDATTGKKLQQKIDAIDSAGRELARLEGEAVAKMSPTARLQVLRDKIIRYSKALMHFDHFAIRVLNKRTNKLEMVFAEGLPAEAVDIDLYAQPEGNGISGYVAATGRSYICHDTEKDPRYVLGIEHCKSSLTVPLRLHDKVVGVFNIESERVGAFNEEDRQFAEIFGRYVGLALNILDLLVVESCTIRGQLADNVVQEMAQPLNDIVTEAQTLREEYIGDDMMRNRLDKITDYVESIRTTLREVAAGPKTVLGVKDEIPKDLDPLISDKQVLIADDEPNIRKTIADVLTKLGAACCVCKDGYEALHQIEQRDFDLVISDIKMPHRNGYDIFAAARRRREDTPVMLMTGFGYDPHHSIVRATEEGLSAVLYKPFKVSQLLEEVRIALGHGSAAQPRPEPAPDGE